MRLIYSFVFVTMLAAASDTTRVALPIGAEMAGVWRVSKASADVPVGAVSPKLILAPPLSQTKVATAEFVSVSFDISEKGMPLRIRIDKSSNENLDDEVIAMIREWRFEAARNGGVAVGSRAYVDLSGEEDAPPVDGRRPFRKSKG